MCVGDRRSGDGVGNGPIGRELGGEGLARVRDAHVLYGAWQARGLAGPLSQPHGQALREARHDEHRLLGACEREDRAAVGQHLGYILAYPSLEARQKSWDGFMADPDWNAARNESEKNGKLLEKIDSVFLKATDYSAIK